MANWKRTKETIKYLSRKYAGYDPGLRNVKIGDDFLDQKKLLSGKTVRIIFDVGANIGQTTQKYRRLFPGTEIYGFEPYAEAYERYVISFDGDTTTHPVNIALSNSAGVANLFINNNHYTNSLLPIEKSTHLMDNIKAVGKISVITETLDGFCDKHGIGHVDILKLDVQGGELLVLTGAEKMLVKRAIGLIYTEVEFVSLYKNQPLFEEIKKYLGKYGYILYKNYNIEHDASHTPTTADAIFIKQDLIHDISQPI